MFHSSAANLFPLAHVIIVTGSQSVSGEAADSNRKRAAGEADEWPVSGRTDEQVGSYFSREREQSSFVLISKSVSPVSLMTSVVRILTHCDANVTQSTKVLHVDPPAASQSETRDEVGAGVLFITSNPGKLREVMQILGQDFPFRIEPVSLDLEETQDQDPDMIAIRKCGEAVRRLNNQPLIIEDSCLSFDALDGLPGPYVKWFEKKIGNEGLVRLLTGFPDKRASAVASVSYWDGKEMVMFKGIVRGTIVEPRTGPEPSFGWDPIFVPSGGDKTFAEMGSAAKNQISHRVRALDLFKNYVHQNKQLLSNIVATI